jgi:hypothetical protein
MTFQPGQSGNPAGRPKGSKNRATAALRASVESHAEDVIRVLADAARAGSVSAAKALLDRVLPPARQPLCDLQLSAGDHGLGDIADALISAVAAGDAPPGDALQLGSLLKLRAELTDVDELMRRIAALEGAMKVRS